MFHGSLITQQQMCNNLKTFQVANKKEKYKIYLFLIIALSLYNWIKQTHAVECPTVVFADLNTQSDERGECFMFKYMSVGEKISWGNRQAIVVMLEKKVGKIERYLLTDVPEN